MGLELTDSAEKLELLRTFEAVLYKYDGAFKNEDMWALNNYYEFAVGDPADSKVWIGMNNHNIKTFNVQDGEEAETISGNYYVGILGRPDGGLFARIDPTSPEYVHSEYF